MKSGFAGDRTISHVAQRGRAAPKVGAGRWFNSIHGDIYNIIPLKILELLKIS